VASDLEVDSGKQHRPAWTAPTQWFHRSTATFFFPPDFLMPQTFRISMSRRRAPEPPPEDEEEEESPQSSARGDRKDQIIAEQVQMIRELQEEFSGTLEALQTQLHDYVEESSRVQNDMLERIKELKEELTLARRKSGSKQTGGVRSSLYAAGPKRPRKLAHAER
jgi:arginyl-tRNA synthetase